MLGDDRRTSWRLCLKLASQNVHLVQFDSDPQAFGVNTVPNPPSPQEKENLESVAGDDSASELSSVGTVQSARRETGSRAPRRRGLRKVLLAAVAVGAAAVVRSRRK